MKSSNVKDHADGNHEDRGNYTPGNVIGSDGNLTHLNGSRTSDGVAQIWIHSQIASQGT
jgi:hypothetical protein